MTSNCEDEKCIESTKKKEDRSIVDDVEQKSEEVNRVEEEIELKEDKAKLDIKCQQEDTKENAQEDYMNKEENAQEDYTNKEERNEDERTHVSETCSMYTTEENLKAKMEEKMVLYKKITEVNERIEDLEERLIETSDDEIFRPFIKKIKIKPKRVMELQELPYITSKKPDSSGHLAPVKKEDYCKKWLECTDEEVADAVPPSLYNESVKLPDNLLNVTSVSRNMESTEPSVSTKHTYNKTPPNAMFV